MIPQIPEWMFFVSVVHTLFPGLLLIFLNNFFNDNNVFIHR